MGPTHAHPCLQEATARGKGLEIKVLRRIRTEERSRGGVHVGVGAIHLNRAIKMKCLYMYDVYIISNNGCISTI